MKQNLWIQFSLVLDNVKVTIRLLPLCLYDLIVYFIFCLFITQAVYYIMACVASVSVGLEQIKTEEPDFWCFARVKNGPRAKVRKSGVGEEKERKGNACRQSPGF